MQLFRDSSFIYYYNQTLLYVLMFFFHWLFDFVMQQGGDKKHEDNKILLYHVFYYSVMMTLVYSVLSYYLILDINWWFFPVTFCSHLITDYITSRINHKVLIKYGPGKKLVSHIGFDQWLHHAQLFLTI